MAASAFSRFKQNLLPAKSWKHTHYRVKHRTNVTPTPTFWLKKWLCKCTIKIRKWGTFRMYSKKFFLLKAISRCQLIWIALNWNPMCLTTVLLNMFWNLTEIKRIIKYKAVINLIYALVGKLADRHWLKMKPRVIMETFEADIATILLCSRPWALQKNNILHQIKTFSGKINGLFGINLQHLIILITMVRIGRLSRVWIPTIIIVNQKAQADDKKDKHVFCNANTIELKSLVWSLQT